MPTQQALAMMAGMPRKPTTAQLAETFRHNLRERMDELGLTGTTLAKRLKVTPAFVYQMMSGHRNPGLESLRQFATALGVEPGDLLREKILSE